MNIEKLSTHISASLWINKSKIVDVLETYKEVEEEPNDKPKERDYTGVKFKHSDNGKENIIEKCTYLQNHPYSIRNGAIHYTQKEVDNLFSSGYWIEVNADFEPSENIGQLQKRVEALESAVFATKKNLYVKIEKIKRVLSYNDVMTMAKLCLGGVYMSYMISDNITFTNYVKQRL
jgi:hypothetical protein